MPVEEDDIIFDDGPEGLSRSIRFIEGDNVTLDFNHDIDFPKIKTVTINATGGGGYDGDPTVIAQDPDHRFVTDIERGIWNGKLDEPTGTPDGTKYLRDDNTWQPVSGSGLSQQQVEGLI